MSRTDYRLGPGDELAVSVFGDVNQLHVLSVTPEGTVVVPSLGVVDVLDLNLNQAEARIRALVLRYFRNVEVSTTLSGLRAVKVFVLGDVPEPGVRVASTATRASEVVPSAGADGILHRNILLRRARGDTVRIDLARFRQTGDLRLNPTLREGDALIVPRVDERVRVFGRVAFPGSYQFRRDESLAEFLELANGTGGFPADAADTIRIARFVGPEERELHVLSRAEALGPRGQRFILQPFDAIHVPGISNFKRQRFATVEGQVRRPGSYPIVPGVTTVCDLVALAGGFTPEASLIEATLRRREGDRADWSGEPETRRRDEAGELAGIPPELLGEDERQILQIRSRGDETNVVVDFEGHCSGEADVPQQTLAAGDRLLVPRLRNEVIVLGAVANPGIVQYVPGHTADYFVSLAGGYTDRADRGDAVVLKAKLGTRVDAKEVSSIRPGDTVVVPYKERRRLVDRVRDVNAVLSPVATLVVTILAVSRVFDNDNSP